MEIPDPDQPNRFAQQLFTPLPDALRPPGRGPLHGTERSLAEGHGRPHRARPPRAGARRGLGHGRRGHPDSPTAAAPGSSDSTSPSTCCAREHRNVAEHLVDDRVQLVAGRAEQTPFADRTFDALTFTYLLRYVDDPQATLTELARVVKPGGRWPASSSSSPKSRFWRFWWWLYTRLVLPAGGWLTGGKGVVRGGPVPRPQHLGPLPALPGGVDGRGLEAGRLRRRRRATDEPGWRPGHVGPARRCMKPRRREAPTPSSGPPSTRHGPAAGGTGGRCSIRPTPAWHLAYVVIGACLAPIVNVTRLIATLLAFFLRRRAGRPRARRTARPAAAHPDPRCRARRRGRRSVWPERSPSGSPASSRWVRRWCPSSSSDPSSSWATTSSSSAGIIHNDIGFAASWGAFPVLTAYVAQTGRLALAPVIAAVGAFGLSMAQRALSTPARLLRRRATDVAGSIELADGRSIPVDRAVLLAPLERALRAMSWAVMLLAAALAVARLR